AGDYSAKATEFVFNARAKLHVSNTFNFGPYGFLAIVSAEPKEDAVPAGGTATPTAVKATALAFAFGVGGEYRTSHIYLAGGVSYQRVRAKVEATTTAAGVSATTTATVTYQGLPVINVGGEWWFTDWLAGRAGYQRSIATTKLKTETPAVGTVPAATTESNRTTAHSFIAVGGLGPFNNDGVVNLGLGFKFGNFALDATVSEEALRRGLGLIGAQDNLNTFGYITTSYSFQ
ncbi:MAG: hypothetical protein HY708_06860, partial [Ignavibacteriae bacterium]|nr:hypothetical protein [Ignavibacteriota bacterium]